MVLVEAVFGGIRRRAFRTDTLDREFRREVRFVDHGKRACQVPAITQNATRTADMQVPLRQSDK